MDRSAFFKEAFRRTAKAGLDFLEERGVTDLLDAAATSEERALRQRQRPPGASPAEEAFLAACTGCDRCMAACPVNIIMIENLTRRDPVIYPETDPCIHCAGYPCIAACPTGALSPDRETERLRIL